MTPTEKHRETARAVLAEIHKTGLYMDAVEVLMIALANAEREGMKRAADELESVLEKRKSEKKKSCNDYIASSIGYLRHLVARAEAGEG